MPRFVQWLPIPMERIGHGGGSSSRRSFGAAWLATPLLRHGMPDASGEGRPAPHPGSLPHGRLTNLRPAIDGKHLGQRCPTCCAVPWLAFMI